MFLRLTLVLGLAVVASAHPPVSVVIDAGGNIYYSDLERVWHVAPDGTKSIAVPNVHTHELYLDPLGNLFGEHLWYEGDRTKAWGHYVWRRSPNGKVTLVVPRAKGFLENYGFVRDRAGAMYFIDPTRREVRKRTGNRITTVARGFTGLRWLHATPGGTLYLMDRGDLVRIARDGKVTRLVRNLGAGILGIWADQAENVYLADHARREVKRVSPRGQVTVAARSAVPWSPAGGVVATNGELVLLEVSVTHAIRIRRVKVRP